MRNRTYLTPVIVQVLQLFEGVDSIGFKKQFLSLFTQDYLGLKVLLQVKVSQFTVNLYIVIEDLDTVMIVLPHVLDGSLRHNADAMPFILKTPELLEGLVDSLLTVHEILYLFYYFKLFAQIVLFLTLQYPVEITSSVAVGLQNCLDRALQFIGFGPEFFNVSTFLCKIQPLLIEFSLCLLVKELLNPGNIIHDLGGRTVLNYEGKRLHQFLP
ncbi:MAG: hypothetical protein BWY89_02047 [Bacteroidetes bacterium ADurb.BinA012]|nr:MAG: hypothetical protein BWY89_02047 [Bacteroidetes bacterium ADurb.BinA012]